MLPLQPPPVSFMGVWRNGSASAFEAERDGPIPSSPEPFMLMDKHIRLSGHAHSMAQDGDQHRAYMREWARRKRAGLPTRTTPIRTPEEIIESARERRRRYRKRAMDDVNRIFGKSCQICGLPHVQGFHRKDGQKHDTTCTPLLARREPEKWARLCFSCHHGVHFCMRFLKWDWERIQKEIGRWRKRQGKRR